jgi:very-short-patch-repair endonuclease
MDSLKTVASQLAHWRDELINLGKGNRLLYYKATKTSTLAIGEPAPSTVLGRLREPGKEGWHFYFPAGEPVETATALPAPLPPRAPDELLTSKTDAQSLGATLRNLKRRAEQEFLDKGLSVLYLGIGMLEWTDPAEQVPAQSPLLLVPVTLTRDNPRQPFTLVRAEEEASINPALAVKLGNDFGIQLPSLESVDELDPETILALVAASIADHPSWQVSAAHLKRYLDFAQRGLAALAMELGPSGLDVESPFEEEVARVIRSWGYDVVPQVGCAEYRIDLGLRHPAKPGTFALGIECDGAMYHSSKVARDRDRLRQEVLERLGWKLHRIWGTGWYRDRPGQEVRLRKAIEQAINGAPVGTSRPTPRPAAAAQELVELESVALDAMPSWAVSYREAKLTVRRGQIEMHDPAAREEIKRLIVEVVSVESPVHQALVLRRVRAAWGLGRAGSRIRVAFEAALASLVRKDSVRRDPHGFLWLPQQQLSVVRGAVAEETRRTVGEVPEAEMRLAVLRLVMDALSISWEELSTRVTRLFGWTRRGADISDAVDDAIRKLTAEGLLRSSEGKMLQVVARVEGH